MRVGGGGPGARAMHNIMASLGNCNSKSSTSSGTPVTRFDKNQCTGTRVLVFVPGLKYLLVLTIPGVLRRTTMYNFSRIFLWKRKLPFCSWTVFSKLGTLVRFITYLCIREVAETTAICHGGSGTCHWCQQAAGAPDVDVESEATAVGQVLSLRLPTCHRSGGPGQPCQLPCPAAGPTSE